MKIFWNQYCFVFALVTCLSGFAGELLAQDDEGKNGFDRPAMEVEATDEPMYKTSYWVPPTFLNPVSGGGGGDGIDPFADLVESKSKPKKLPTAQAILEEAGIQFPPGASAFFDRKSSKVVIVNTLDQLDLADIFLYTGGGYVEKQIQFFVEFIEVEAALYHDWMFENRMAQVGNELRTQAQKWVKAGEGTIIETVAVICRSGQRSKTQSVRQIYYPTNANPSTIPNKVDLEGAETRAPIAASMPVAFDRRDVGTTVEVDAILGADSLTIDLSAAPEIVSNKGTIDWPPKDGDPLFTVSLPEFHTMKISTQVTTQHGRYKFLGTTTPLEPAIETRKRPLVMMFVRGDVLTLGEDKLEPFERVPVEKK